MTPAQRKQKRRLYIKRLKNLELYRVRYWWAQLTKQELKDRKFLYTPRRIRKINREVAHWKKCFNEGKDKQETVTW
jgi:hypothetical protein